ncbi:hypothetical protein PBAL39_23938 [Pedobacter sp. BAL39]|uniref:hypothetical protein n=1 Tax=Pedobacter sp. BAL39 TaxID=391596 RepID=UPI000155AF62|nr:hypothetical protein [Pedobacter sp. BAL39]EDM34587.1 hypothetical protein PBAL39_23938 [Pedobacter sp. BAL39]
MSFLNGVINKLEEGEQTEELRDRLEIIQHKIKFMDKVPVACMDSDNRLNTTLEEFINFAGGVLEENPSQARVVIYFEPQRSMLDLMGLVPAMMQSEWPAVEYNRLYILDDQSATSAEDLVVLVEDIAEMLYPGYFVFGNEGKNWMSFGV